MLHAHQSLLYKGDVAINACSGTCLPYLAANIAMQLVGGGLVSLSNDDFDAAATAFIGRPESLREGADHGGRGVRWPGIYDISSHPSLRSRSRMCYANGSSLSACLETNVLEDSFDRYLARWGSADRMQSAM